MWSSWFLRVLTGRDDTVTLSFPVRKVTVMIDDDVTSLSWSFWTDDSLHGDDLSCVRIFGFVQVQRRITGVFQLYRRDGNFGAACLLNRHA